MDLNFSSWRSTLPEQGTYDWTGPTEHYVEVELPPSEQDAGYPEPAVMHVALWMPNVPEGTLVPVIATVHPYYEFAGSNPNTIPDLGVGQWVLEEFVPHGYALAQISTFGAGKSTQLKIIAGLEEATTGQVVRQGELNIAYLQQEFDVNAKDDEKLETTMPSMRPLALIENKYFVAMGIEGLYIIDFHAAHERVMYERLKNQARFKRVGKQDLLKPISLELSKSEATAFEKMLPEINNMGFDAEKFGPSSFVIRSVPALLAGSEPERIREAIDDVVESGSMKSAEERHQYMMYTVASVSYTHLTLPTNREV